MTTDTNPDIRVPAPQPTLRPANQIMRLARMGCRHQTRLSFMRILLRRLEREHWRVEPMRHEWDADGFGTAVLPIRGPTRRYSLIAFTQPLDPSQRSDRVTAERWDACFVLFDGEPSDADIERLRANAPYQEAGRYRSSELTLSRANRSVRLFNHVVSRLAEGRQPEPQEIATTGYLMRTTAVYGNGKFGLADRARTCARDELAAPYQAELLTVYLIRHFTHELVEHIAQRRNPTQFTPLERANRRYLGIGNSTGLGMAPFLYHHPLLIHQWVLAVETALLRVRALEHCDAPRRADFLALLKRARQLCLEWRVADRRQDQRIVKLRQDLAHLQALLCGELAATPSPLCTKSASQRPWDALYRWGEANLSTEAQELLVSLLLESHPESTDPLAEQMGTTAAMHIDPTMSLEQLLALIDQHYAWIQDYDFTQASAQHYFWYTSEVKLEPRLGQRELEPGAEREHLLSAARDISALRAALEAQRGQAQRVGAFLLYQPQHRHSVRRVQSLAACPYAEIRDNLLDQSLLPLDMLRFKLSFFGANKFDPKSDKWTRITLYQGAPLSDELHRSASDRGMFLPLIPGSQLALEGESEGRPKNEQQP